MSAHKTDDPFGFRERPGVYDTGTVQHAHLENHVCFAQAEGEAHIGAVDRGG